MQGFGSCLAGGMVLFSACGGRTALELAPNDSSGAVHSGGSPGSGAAPSTGGSPGASGAFALGGAPSTAGAPSSAGGNVNGGQGGVQAQGGRGMAGSAGVRSRMFATAVSAGTDMTCVVERSGGVWCWGSNDYGQLGDGTRNASELPVRVANIDDAISVSTGGTWISGGKGATLSAFACARRRDDTLACWGRSFDWLAIPSGSFSTVPVSISGIGAVTDIAAGSEHLCALSNGSVVCWGDDTWGQLGDGDPTMCASSGCPSSLRSTPAPAQIAGLDAAAAISAHGSYFTCALLSDATVKCWGMLTGTTGTSGTTVSPPVTIPGVTASTTGLAVGYYHACAVAPSGAAIHCWGDNDHGQLGDGTTDVSSAPVAVQGLAGAVVGVSAGLAHTCAVLVDGRIQCWGYNAWGELGNGTRVSSSVPVTVSGIADALAVSAGYIQTCAVTKSGRVLCWGQSFASQVGNGDPTTDAVSTPVEVTGF